ncbi:hypothetical protein ACS0TY_007507 [Phlomoides rotata]
MEPLLDPNKKEKLLSCIVRGKLQDVIDAYVENPEVRKLEMRTGDTALHVAASEGWGVYAERMVESGADVLAIGNEQGDTALHLAAKFGNTYFCKCIAETDIKLVKIPNESGETPLFSAVSRGKTQDFLYLYRLCSKDIPPQDQHDMYTRKNGDTILHSAIFEEHFGTYVSSLISSIYHNSKVSKTGAPDQQRWIIAPTSSGNQAFRLPKWSSSVRHS